MEIQDESPTMVSIPNKTICLNKRTMMELKSEDDNHQPMQKIQRLETSVPNSSQMHLYVNKPIQMKSAVSSGSKQNDQPWKQFAGKLQISEFSKFYFCHTVR